MQMKNHVRWLLVLLLIVFNGVSAVNNDSSDFRDKNVNIYERIKSKDAIQQIYSLQYVIKNAALINHTRIVFDLMSLYKNGKSLQIQYLAILALDKIGSSTAIRYLNNEYFLQADPRLRQAIGTIVRNRNQNKVIL